MTSSNLQQNITLTLNTKIYPLEVIYSAAYIFLDKAYFYIEGDPNKEVKLTLYPKQATDANKLKLEFLNECVNQSSFMTKLEKNNEIFKLIVEKALFTSSSYFVEDPEDEEIQDLLKELENEDDEEIKALIKDIQNDSKKKQ